MRIKRRDSEQRMRHKLLPKDLRIHAYERSSKVKLHIKIQQLVAHNNGDGGNRKNMAAEYADKPVTAHNLQPH
ncbi:hypothetical protein Tco_0878237 [Tanacetum coccineum]|uniref:Uncharacterized protein n=1 Tax=Tanacetum coccineum TaxID=301880 RepID=A0ABQ5C027_9ASTR